MNGSITLTNAPLSPLLSRFKDIVYDGSIRRGRHTVGIRTYSAPSGTTSPSAEKMKYTQSEFFVEFPGVLVVTVKQKDKFGKDKTYGPGDKLKEVSFKPNKGK
jgi:hypothetical protein